jgi:putative spermidine/putrescine transport system substrate-binding protein
MQRRDLIASAGLLAAAGLPGIAHARAAQAICYNCPPEWADWGGMLRLIGQRLNIAVPPDNKNSGQALAALIAERASPVADIAYFGGQFGPKARAAGVLTPYRPARFADIPVGMKDPDGYWHTIHSGTLGLFVNTAALRGRPVPQAWADLLRPEYRGMVGYLNPAAAAVGQLGVIAVNFAFGGSYDNLDPGIDFFRRLRANAPIVPMQTAYARVLSGEIPILFDFDFNAYRARHRDNAPTTFVIPQEGTRQLPYIMGLVARGPNPEQGRRILDFLLSDEGQRHWANAFMRPVFAAAMTPEIKARFLPDTEYARARMVDVFRLAAASTVIAERYRRDLG